MKRDYYYTWTAQKEAEAFDLRESKGCFLYLENGEKIFDFVSTSYHLNFGHTPKEIIKILHQQLDILPVASPRTDFQLKSDVTKSLLDYLNLKKGGKVFYTVSGAESIENALKMARRVSGKKIILCRQNSYHGATQGALSITGDWRNSIHQTMDDWIRRIPEPFDDPKLIQTEKMINEVGAENIAGFCLETITGNNGVIIPDSSWYEGISRLCQKYNIFLILDEVMGAFHRTGRPLALHHYPQLDPDFVCLAKAISGGLIPFGAVWTSPKISNFYQEEVLACGLTNYAHPMGLAALKAVLKILEDKSFQENMQESSKHFKLKLAKLESHPAIKKVRSIGLLACIDLHKLTNSKSDFLKNGVYLITGPNRILLAPPLIATSNEIDLGFNAILKTLGDSFEL